MFYVICSLILEGFGIRLNFYLDLKNKASKKNLRSLES
jgi:hypothetical protein